MTKNQNFIETKEYKRFAEFCDACIKYQYIGICYGQPGVGKTLSSRYYTNWDTIEKQVNQLVKRPMTYYRWIKYFILHQQKNKLN